jgi:hypothetical protein
LRLEFPVAVTQGLRFELEGVRDLALGT